VSNVKRLSALALIYLFKINLQLFVVSCSVQEGVERKRKKETLENFHSPVFCLITTLFFPVLRMELSTECILGKCSTT
jgi:hypothetical protein